AGRAFHPDHRATGLARAATDVAAEFERQAHLPLRGVLRARFAEIVRAVEAFAAFDLATLGDWQPVWFEERATVPFAELVLGGQLDRIDRHRGTGALRVVDYKRRFGVHWQTALATQARRGEKLQAPRHLRPLLPPGLVLRPRLGRAGWPLRALRLRLDLPEELRAVASQARAHARIDTVLGDREAVSPASSIEAGAGTGKTTRVVRLLLQSLLATGTEPSRLLALTFTVRAANEMRDRLGTWLARLVAGEAVVELQGGLELFGDATLARARGLRALAELDRIEI